MREYIAGYNQAIESIEGYCSNLDVFIGEGDIEGEDINIFRYLQNHPQQLEVLKTSIKYWLETEREMIITAMEEEC